MLYVPRSGKKKFVGVVLRKLSKRNTAEFPNSFKTYMSPKFHLVKMLYLHSQVVWKEVVGTKVVGREKWYKFGKILPPIMRYWDLIIFGEFLDFFFLKNRKIH